MTANSFEKDKQGLIDLIEWYREKFHKPDSVCDDLIAAIRDAKTDAEFEQYNQVVDSWLDS